MPQPYNMRGVHNSLLLTKLKGDSLGVDRGVHEEGCEGIEPLGAFGGEIFYRASTGASFCHRGVTTEVIFKAFGHQFSLREDSDMPGGVLSYLWQKQGIVGAAEDESVDFRVGQKELIDIFFYKIIGSVSVELTGLYEWHPHRAFLLGDLHAGVDFLNLHPVGMASDRALRGEEPDVT